MCRQHTTASPEKTKKKLKKIEEKIRIILIFLKSRQRKINKITDPSQINSLDPVTTDDVINSDVCFRVNHQVWPGKCCEEEDKMSIF
jgi:hypothetical protein